MDLLNHLALGFGVALSLQNLLYAFLGAVLGTLIGVLPGLGPVATIAMLLPSIYSLDDSGPTPLKPVTPAEAYLTHWILEGNTDPARNIYWGVTSKLTTRLDGSGERRHAGVKTGTTNNFRDVTTFGYLPGSIVTGVWMGNNNQAPMADNLFAATGPLYLWHEFMNLAINKPWDWNGKKIVPQTDFPQPNGVTMTSVCRWTGLAPSPACGRTVTVPFLDGTQPQTDDSWSNGCLDLVKFVREQGRPDAWATAAKTFEDRIVNGQWGSSGNIKDPNADPAKLKYPIAPIPGERGFPALCGVRVATPPPSRTPNPKRSRYLSGLCRFLIRFHRPSTAAGCQGPFPCGKRRPVGFHRSHRQDRHSASVRGSKRLS